MMPDMKRVENLVLLYIYIYIYSWDDEHNGNGKDFGLTYHMSSISAIPVLTEIAIRACTQDNPGG